MKKKLYVVLVEIASLAILLTIICVSILFYKGFEKQVLSDLELITETYSLLSLEQIQEMENNAYLQKNIRVSIVAPAGDVIFDPKLQRTISVDIRYVLFIIDKYVVHI